MASTSNETSSVNATANNSVLGDAQSLLAVPTSTTPFFVDLTMLIVSWLPDVLLLVMILLFLLCLRRSMLLFQTSDGVAYFLSLLTFKASLLNKQQRSSSTTSEEAADELGEERDGTRRRKKMRTGGTNSRHSSPTINIAHTEVEMEPLMSLDTIGDIIIKSPSGATQQTEPSKKELPLPALRGCDGHQPLLSPHLIRQLLPYLPELFAYHDWTLLYSTSLHGHSLTTFYHQLTLNHDHDGPNLLLIRDSDDYVFGCFTPVSWHSSELYYSNCQCFVFTAYPKFQVYEAVEAAQKRNSQSTDSTSNITSPATTTSAGGVHLGRASPTVRAAVDGTELVRSNSDSQSSSYYMLAHSDYIAMGGGSRFAFWLDSAFRTGSTGFCTTFNSPPLAKKATFKCYELECWGF